MYNVNVWIFATAIKIYNRGGSTQAPPRDSTTNLLPFHALTATSDALCFHLMRVHYQAIVWRNAHTAIPVLPAPVDMGLETW